MSATDQCPPVYVPTRSECNAAKEQSKEFLLAAGLNPLKWDFDAMGCSCGSHIEDVPGHGQEPSRGVTATCTAAARPDPESLPCASGGQVRVVDVPLVADSREFDSTGIAEGIVEETGKPVVELRVNVSFVDKSQLRRRRDPENGMSRITSITSAATPEECAATLSKRLEDAVLQRPDDSVVKVQGHVATTEPVYQSSHNSSPSVGAPSSGAVCDNPNPTDGELSPGAASPPNGVAPDPTRTTVQE